MYTQHASTRRSGAMPPRKYLKNNYYKIESESNFSKNDRNTRQKSVYTFELVNKTSGTNAKA